MKTAKTLNWVVVVLGVWEFIAAFILGYTNKASAEWDAIIIGIALVILAGWAALANQMGTIKTLSWINTILGVWLVIAPFILSYTSIKGAMWNDIIVGIIVAVLSVWAANTKTA